MVPHVEYSKLSQILRSTVLKYLLFKYWHLDFFSECSWQDRRQEIPFICSTLLHSYRILCASPDMPFCPCPVPCHTHTLTHRYTHKFIHVSRIATFSAICAVFHVHVHVHVQDMKIFQSAYIFRSLSLSSSVTVALSLSVSLCYYFSHPLYIDVYVYTLIHMCVLHIQVGKLCTYIIIMEMVWLECQSCRIPTKSVIYIKYQYFWKYYAKFSCI